MGSPPVRVGSSQRLLYLFIDCRIGCRWGIGLFSWSPAARVQYQRTLDVREPRLAGALKKLPFIICSPGSRIARPERQAVFGIEVSVPSRSELVVRVRRGFFDIEPEPPVTTKKSPIPHRQPIRQSINKYRRRWELPTRTGGCPFH